MSSVPDCLLDRYYVDSTIGEGTYGVVYRGFDSVRKIDVALKKVRVDVSAEGIGSTTLREISVLRDLVHPNIIQLIDVIYTGDKLFLMFEYLDIDLRCFMDHSDHPFSHALIKSYAHQLLQALDYCHLHKVVHRDVKPQNLLLNETGYIKIADFGLARSFGVPMRNFTHEVVTLYYRAPEILLGTNFYTIAVDLWSLGCILAELFKKRPLFPGDSEIDQLFKIFRALGTPNDDVWPNVSCLPDYKPYFPHWERKPFNEILPDADEKIIPVLEALLEYNPEKRICAENVLHLSYFNDVKMVEVPFFKDVLRARDDYTTHRRLRRDAQY